MMQTKECDFPVNVKTTVPAEPCARPHISSGVSAANIIKLIMETLIMETLIMETLIMETLIMETTTRVTTTMCSPIWIGFAGSADNSLVAGCHVHPVQTVCRAATGDNHHHQAAAG